MVIMGRAWARLGKAAVAVFIAASSTAVQGQSLSDALVTAYRNSNLLEQNRALLRASDEGVAVAVSALRPVVNFVANSTARGPSPGTDQLNSSVGITAAITVFDFGNNRLGVDAAKESVLATRQALLNVEQQVLLSAVTAFFDVRQASTVVGLQQNNLQLITRELQAARDRFEVGEVTRTDVAVAEARLGAVRSSLAAAQGALARAREAYKVAVGEFPGGLGAPGALPRPAVSLSQAKSVGQSINPLLRQAQHQVRVAELNAQRADRSLRPVVDLQGSVNADDDGDVSSSVTLGLTAPLYQGGRLSALYRQALANRDQSRATLLQTARTVEQGVGNAWADLNVANARLLASEDEVRSSRLAFEGLREEAALGARTTLDVLDAEQDLLDAQTDRAEAVNDRFTAAYSVLAAMGMLTAQNLQLPVPTYDPAAYYNAVKDAPATSSRGKRLDRVLKSIGKE